MKRKWYYVKYVDGFLIGRKLPMDVKWSVWKDRFGNVEVARFKYDAIDHFYPHTNFIKEEDIKYWKPCKITRNKFLSYNRR